MAGFPLFGTAREQSRSPSSDSSADKLKDKDLERSPQVAGGLSDSDSGEIGRQIELEAENSIKYRTCSWQKVCFQIYLILVAAGSLQDLCFVLIRETLDGRAALL